MITLVKLFKRYILRLLLTAASMLILAVPLAWMQLHHPANSHSLAIIFSQYTGFFTGFRWIVIITLVITWPSIIHLFARKQQWSPEKTSFWLSQRYRLAAWLIIIELLVCESWLLSLSKLL